MPQNFVKFPFQPCFQLALGKFRLHCRKLGLKLAPIREGLSQILVVLLNRNRYRKHLQMLQQTKKQAGGF